MIQVIAPQMAVGTFNAGLLATESGSLGRFLGNIGITIIGTGIRLGQGTQYQQGKTLVLFGDVMYGAFAGLALVCLIAIIIGRKCFKG